MAARVLGIDAGFAALGVVVAEGDRVLYAATCRTERTDWKRGVRVADDDAERCQRLARFLVGIIREWQPAGAIVELPSGGAQGARANRAMGMASGVVAAVLEVTGLPAEWVTPQAVKRAAGGRRDASKAQVAEGVRARLDWSEVRLPAVKADLEHIYDAAGALLAARDGTLMRALAVAAGSRG